MTQAVTAPNALMYIATLVGAGKMKAATYAAKSLLATADPAHLAILVKCAEILTDYPHKAALGHLRNGWLRTEDPQARELIAACAAQPNTNQYIPESDPRPAPNPHYRRPGKLNVTKRPDLIKGQPRGKRALKTRQAMSKFDPATATAHEIEQQRRRENWLARRARQAVTRDGLVYGAYAQDRAGVEDDPRRHDDPDAVPYASGNLDYDKNATRPLRGTYCVYCLLERDSASQNTHGIRADGTRRASDDGLCERCREMQRPGMIELAEGHTLSEAVMTRCQFIADHHPGQARAYILKEQQRAHPEIRVFVSKYLHVNREQLLTAAAISTRARCQLLTDRDPAAYAELINAEWKRADHANRVTIRRWANENRDRLAEAARLATAPSPAPQSTKTPKTRAATRRKQAAPASRPTNAAPARKSRASRPKAAATTADVVTTVAAAPATPETAMAHALRAAAAARSLSACDMCGDPRTLRDVCQADNGQCLTCGELAKTSARVPALV